MLRLDGEVFLLGTAIAAPLKSIKIATICASSRQESPGGDSRGGTRIVANRGSYSACSRRCKSGGGQNRVSDEGVGAPFVAESGHWAVAGDEVGVVAHRPEPGGDRADQLLLVAVRKIPAADRALEQY